MFAFAVAPARVDRRAVTQARALARQCAPETTSGLAAHAMGVIVAHGDTLSQDGLAVVEADGQGSVHGQNVAVRTGPDGDLDRMVILVRVIP